MINVNKGSLWYRLALYGVFFEEMHLSPNLCPFMRRVLFGIILIAAYVFIGAYFIMATGTPPLQLIMVMLHGAAYLEPNGAMIIGSCIWFVVMICVIGWFFADTDAGLKVRTVVGDTYTSLHFDDMLLVKWVIAKHNKICPQLEFTGHIDDANIAVGTETEE